MASSSSSSSSKYDVFINHRGPDVKNTFASHLYRRLTECKLRVFLDREEMVKGEKIDRQIELAIQTACVQIAIFSPNYCESRWCLDELVLMLKSRSTGSTVIPIFYNVKPSELRCKKGDKVMDRRSLHIFKPRGCTQDEIGVFARGLRNLTEKKTFDPDTILKWREALSNVADISGFELKECNGDEGRLLVDVVTQVMEKVRKTPLNVSKYPIILDDTIKEFEEKVLLQHHGNGKARVIGIVGAGGIGKTTLVKEYLSRERKNYQCSCFLFDVKGSCLKSLQSTLIYDIRAVFEQITSTADGAVKLTKHLHHSFKSSLIILDDVDHIDQLEALISPIKDVLNSASLILVTSRNDDVLTSGVIGYPFIYRLERLNKLHSTQIFCSHAFHQLQPLPKFEQVVNNFVDACNGLPLSLTVIGALLYGKDFDYWNAQMRKISQICPDDIGEILKISYHSLEENEKHILLDIACFFVGEDKDTAITIWNGSGWEGKLGLQKLQSKCLVEFHPKKWSMFDPVLQVDGKESIAMHEHLRDLGRDVAEREPLRRLWRRDANLSPNSPVRGITNIAQCSPSIPDMSNRIPEMSDRQVKNMQLLSIQGSVDKVFRTGQSPRLIWLHWSNCPSFCLPSMIPLDNLRVLCIKGANLKTPWTTESEVPLRLRELHIATDDLLKIPKSIGLLKHLEKIVLEPDNLKKKMCLETLPSEFRHLQCLKHFELRSCSNLKLLPDYFCELTNLEHINLYECSDLQMLPDDFGKLTKLRGLRLSHTKLQTFPDSFRNLTNLELIDLSHCTQLKVIQRFFKNLIHLQYVNLSYCSSLERIPSSWTNKEKSPRIRTHKCNPRLFSGRS